MPSRLPGRETFRCSEPALPTPFPGVIPPPRIPLGPCHDHRFRPPALSVRAPGEIKAIADRHPGGAIDLSIGTPCDPAAGGGVAALAEPGRAEGYPPSIGTLELRTAAADWIARRLGAKVDPDAEMAACVGTKEFVASVPQHLKLRTPARDTVLYPAISYPTYELGAILAGAARGAVPELNDLADADATGRRACG